MTNNEELKLRLASNDFDNMWEIVYDILMKVSGKLYESENFDKIFSPYILCRYISMKKTLIDYAEILNDIHTNSGLTKKQFYKFAYRLIPRQYNGYVKYIKKSSKKEKTELENINTSINEVKSNIFDL